MNGKQKNMDISTPERLHAPPGEAAIDLAHESHNPDHVVKAFILERSTIFRELNAIRVKVKGDFHVELST